MEQNLISDNELFSSKPYTFDRFIRLLLTLAVVVGIIFIIRAISTVLVPFFVAILLAYLTDPIVVVLQTKLKIRHRGAAVFITMLLFIMLLAGILWWLVPRFLEEIDKLIFLVKQFLQTHGYRELLPAGIEEWMANILDSKNIQKLLNIQDISQLTSIVFSSARSVFAGSVNIILGIVGVLMVFLYLFFILLDYKKIEDGWQGLVPLKFRPYAINISNDLKTSMRVYFRAQFSIALIVGVLHAIGFSIIDMPMAVTLGLFIGMLNIIPYLQIVGFIPALFLSLLKAMDTETSFGSVVLPMFLVMVIVQIIQETILIPRILGKAYNMNPAIILLSLSVWGSIMGILGMLLALPLTTLIISYYKLFVIKKDPSSTLPEFTRDEIISPGTS